VILFFGKRGAQLVFLFLGQVRLNDFELDALDRRDEFVLDRAAGEQKQSRGAGRHFVFDGIDKFVVNAVIGKMTAERAERRANGQTQKRYKEKQAEQQAPKGAAERAGCRQILKLFSFWFFRAFGPADDGGVLNLNQLLLLQGLQGIEHPLRAFRRIELENAERCHNFFLRAAGKRRLAPCTRAPFLN